MRFQYWRILHYMDVLRNLLKSQTNPNHLGKPKDCCLTIRGFLVCPIPQKKVILIHLPQLSLLSDEPSGKTEPQNHTGNHQQQ